MKPRCSATWSYSARPASLEDCVCQYTRSEEHTSELQSHSDLVCRLLLEKKKKNQIHLPTPRLVDSPVNSSHRHSTGRPGCRGGGPDASIALQLSARCATLRFTVATLMPA